MHVLAVLDPPKAVINAVEKAFSGFLWKHDSSNAVRTWRVWGNLVFPYDENGLGVRSLHDLTTAFSCKMWWKLHRKDGIWAHYVDSIGVGKSSVASRIAKVDDLMLENTRIMICEGNSSFWTDNWTGTGCLVDLFPDVEPISGLVRDFYGPGGWKLDLLPIRVASFLPGI